MTDASSAHDELRVDPAVVGALSRPGPGTVRRLEYHVPSGETCRRDSPPTDGEVDVVRSLSAKASVQHRAVVQDANWLDTLWDAARRLNYSTPHHDWLGTVADWARHHRSSAVSGLGDGIVLNRHLQDPASHRMGSHVE